jgi:hypothetical protein
MMLIFKCLCEDFYVHKFSAPLGKYQGARLLGHMVIIVLFIYIFVGLGFELKTSLLQSIGHTT